MNAFPISCLDYQNLFVVLGVFCIITEELLYSIIIVQNFVTYLLCILFIIMNEYRYFQIYSVMLNNHNFWLHLFKVGYRIKSYAKKNAFLNRISIGYIYIYIYNHVLIFLQTYNLHPQKTRCNTGTIINACLSLCTVFVFLFL